MPSMRMPPSALSSMMSAGSMPCPSHANTKGQQALKAQAHRVRTTSTPRPNVAARKALEIKSIVPLTNSKSGLFIKPSSMQPTRVMEPTQNNTMASKEPSIGRWCGRLKTGDSVHVESRSCNFKAWPRSVPSTKARNTSMG